MTSTRVKEGLAAAAKRGRKGGRPSKQNEKRDAVIVLADAGFKIADIVKETVQQTEADHYHHRRR